ncbi:hypothetical protein fugu_016651 [Takifugu bimaculatus]|uniref:CEP170 C-terminal domain-containing protein n=1 Tax=Takifugu bimaculatus TaxID=433685 RepID=A0A4Z2BV36_9TELE|nr:hypothetical protein fugu_016651 [Takifugu bimaculatus]
MILRVYLASDQETNTHPPYRKYTVPLQKEDGKTSRVSQVLSRTKSLSAPRPTRASMLRRARLGEASDNEGPETEKPVQEVGSAPSKQPQESKKLSRLDMLAMPRKRTNSFNTPSDTEIGRSTGFSNQQRRVCWQLGPTGLCSRTKACRKATETPPQQDTTHSCTLKQCQICQQHCQL